MHAEALCNAQKANVFSLITLLLPQIKELEVPRVPWAGCLKMFNYLILPKHFAKFDSLLCQNESQFGSRFCCFGPWAIDQEWCQVWYMDRG